jgi:YidC/Oxa1 family membrane protein insertase
VKDISELSQETRMLIAVVLSVAVIGVWGYLYRPQQPATTQTAAQKQAGASAPGQTAAQGNNPSASTAKSAASGKTAPGTSSSAGAEVVAHAAPAPRAAQAVETLVVEAPFYRVELSNQGASVRRWELTKYNDDLEKTLDLVHPAVSQQFGGWPLMLALDDSKTEAAVNGALYEMSPASVILQAPAEVNFSWSDGHLAVTKRLKFGTEYVLAIETSVTLDGKPLSHAVAWRGGFGDVTAFAAADNIEVVHSLAGSLTEIAAKKAGDSKEPDHRVTVTGPSDFAGIVDHYFAAAFLPGASGGITLQHWKFDREVEADGKKETEPVAEVAAGAAVTDPLQLRLFVGPKELDALARVRPPLTDLVSYGYLSIIARPLFDFLRWIHGYVRNYGWAIVVMTIVINMVLFPLKYRSFFQMLKMQRVQPEIKQIQDRYKKYSMRDPRRQEMNKEVMEVYNREGVNPIGSCIPTLIQMPFWFALYRMLGVAIELREAPWILWIRDLSARDPYYVLPILMCGTMYIMQKLTPVTTSDPAQQRMMNFMPLMMGFLFFRMASGLVLYILTSNVVGSAQQWFLYQRAPAAGTTGSGKKGADEKKRK